MTKRIAFLVFLAAIYLAGCDWSPLRDNPRDPGASNFDGPPEIRQLRFETHCREFMLDFCDLKVIADIYDPDGISTLDSAWLTLGERALGQMHYDAAEDNFSLMLYEFTEQLPGKLETYMDSVFTVFFMDDAGYIIQKSDSISEPNRSYPGPRSPGDQFYPPDTVRTYWPCFEWARYIWGRAFTYSINCYLNPENRVIWNSEGLPDSCTMVCVELPDSLDNLGDPDFYYSWTVSVVDGDGNSATSLPFHFVVSSSGN